MLPRRPNVLLAALYELPNTDRGGGPAGVVDGSVRYDGGGPAGVVDGCEKMERFLRLGVLGDFVEPGRRKDMMESTATAPVERSLVDVTTSPNLMIVFDPSKKQTRAHRGTEYFHVF